MQEQLSGLVPTLEILISIISKIIDLSLIRLETSLVQKSFKAKKSKTWPQKAKTIIFQVSQAPTLEIPKAQKEKKKNYHKRKQKYDQEEKAQKGFILAIGVNTVNINDSNKNQNWSTQDLSQVTY